VYGAFRMMLGIANLVHAMGKIAAGSGIGKYRAPGQRKQRLIESIKIAGRAGNMELKYWRRSHRFASIAIGSRQ